MYRQVKGPSGTSAWAALRLLAGTLMSLARPGDALADPDLEHIFYTKPHRVGRAAGRHRSWQAPTWSTTRQRPVTPAWSLRSSPIGACRRRPLTTKRKRWTPSRIRPDGPN